MSQHVPEDLLADFVEGSLGEQLAMHIAQHLDSCPACATRVATMDPLAAAFAAVEDPPTPSSLVPDVLAALDRASGGPLVELGIGTGLLAAAAVLVAGWGSPVSALVELGVLGRALLAGLSSLSLSPGSSAVLAVSGMLTLLGCILAARLAVPDRRLP